MVKEVIIQIDEQTIKELGNAIAAYGGIFKALYLNLDVPAKFEAFKDLSLEDLKTRMECLRKLYAQLEEEYERN